MGRNYKRGFSNYLAIYFFIGIIVLGIVLFSVSQILIQRLQSEYNKTSTAYAIVLSMLISSRIPQVTDELTKDIGNTMAFPVIVTDVDGIYIDSKNLKGDITPATPEGMKKLEGLLVEMDSQNEPIPIISYRMNPNTKELEEVVEYYFHYQDPSVIKWLRFLPIGQIILIATFFLIGLMTYRNMKRDEQVALWVGMAKETAHQIGTPISSLMGWIEIFRECDFGGMDNGERENIEKALQSMGQDINRLKRITDRFASIGAKPTLKEYDLETIIRKAVQYSRERLFVGNKDIVLVEDYDESRRVMANSEQISWCVENLFRNSIRSLESKKEGRIIVTVTTGEDDKKAIIKIEDNGVGMGKKVLRYLFYPGFTTKRTGWGMGLSLVKRIIEDYHNGKVRVESNEGEGSKFVLVLPVSEKLDINKGS